MMKEANPDWGVEKISALLLRGPALPASPQAVARVLHEAGYQTEEVATRPHPDHVRRFERARPNQLWQTDLFTFMLKRQNRRVWATSNKYFRRHPNLRPDIIYVERLATGNYRIQSFEVVSPGQDPQMLRERLETGWSSVIGSNNIQQGDLRPIAIGQFP